MDRPVMHPSYLHEQLPPAPSRAKLWQRALGQLWRAMRAILTLLFASPTSLIFGQQRHFRADDGSITTRIIRGLLYRAVFLPVFTAVVAVAFVYLGTHPMTVATKLDPQTHGMYFDRVSYVAGTNVQLESWLIPVLDAKRVISEQNRVFGSRYPAVVLVHDHKQTREQMMPLIKPLHEAGMIVLVAGLRGDPDCTRKGKAMGLSEAEDVKAAVDVLGGRPFVDSERIAVVGFGTGATAAAIASTSDPRIAATVLVNLPPDAESMLAKHVVPDKKFIRWILPLCKWGFEMMYSVDAEDMQVTRIEQALSGRQILKVASNTGSLLSDENQQNTIAFLRSKLADRSTAPAQQVANTQ